MPKHQKINHNTYRDEPSMDSEFTVFEKNHQRPVIINFRPDNTKIYLESLGYNESIFDDWPCSISFVHNFKDLSGSLKLEPRLIIINKRMMRQHGSYSEFMLMYDTLIRYADVSPRPAVSIGICKNTTMEEIKAISTCLFPMSLTMFGIVGSSI